MRFWRVEENAMDNPKFIAISTKAWRLWCEGNAYCQKSLTDGAIPVKAAKGFRYYSRAALRELLTVHVPEKGPLWHEDGPFYRVHDYLDWNEPREKVIANRKAGKERLDRWRAGQAAKRGETPLPETRYETPCDVPSKQNRTEQVQKSTAAARRTGPVEITEATFALYCRIATEARQTSNARDRDDTVSNVTAIFKDLCASRAIAYDTADAPRAIEAAMRAKAS